jgi:hypothetical protein
MNGANVQTTAAAADSHLTEDAARKASFEEAQLLGEQLATILTESCSSGEQMPTEAVSVLRTLVSSTVGARGVSVGTRLDAQRLATALLADSLVCSGMDRLVCVATHQPSL